MIPFLSTTQHKINAAILVALICVIGVFAFAKRTHEKHDAEVEAASLRAVKAAVADSVKQRIIKPQIDSLKAQVAVLLAAQQQQRVKNSLFTLRNENLHKQIDSLNAVVGLRPDF